MVAPFFVIIQLREMIFILRMTELNKNEKDTALKKIWIAFESGNTLKGIFLNIYFFILVVYVYV